MWAEERHHRIMSLLLAQGRIETDSLAGMLNVSRETVRRDLMKLESAGKVRRVHGGVIATELPPEKPFETRRQVNIQEKQRIAKAAVRLLQPGECCFVDAGTTTAAFAVELARAPGIAVITNSLDVASSMRAAQPSADVHLLGGQIGADVPATYGETTIAQIERFRPDVAVISPVALHPDHGAMDYLLPEAEVARAMIVNAGRVIMLADRSKLGEISRVRLCACPQIDVLVVEKGGHPLLGRLSDAGVKRMVEA
jgi:DeoR family transcriptional regulator, fructose operon transcriptional repressor